MKERSEIDRAYDPCQCKHLRFEHIANGIGICARCHVDTSADKACQAFERKITYKALIETLVEVPRSAIVSVSPMTLADILLMLAEGGAHSLPPLVDKKLQIFGFDFQTDDSLADREISFSTGQSVVLD